MNVDQAKQLEFIGRGIILMVLIHSKPAFHSRSIDAKLVADLPPRYIISSTLLEQLHPAPIHFCRKLVLLSHQCKYQATDSHHSTPCYFLHKLKCTGSQAPTQQLAEANSHRNIASSTQYWRPFVGGSNKRLHKTR